VKTELAVAAILLFSGAPAFAHRLDEYLQGTLISVEKNRLDAELTLTPGVAVFPILLADIDTNADGVISEAEQRAYAGRVLRDLSLKIDGYRLMPRLVSMRFPPIGEMKEGLGQIQLEFSTDLPNGGPNRRLVFESHHHSSIAAYQVNCLVPRDPDIRVIAQSRNYQQSFYQLDYAQVGIRSGPLSFAWWSAGPGLLCAIALFLSARLAMLWRRERA
jgi:hypothetical protein